jgi:AhpD family alkylhydroperoxidase
VARKNVKETTMEARFDYFASPLALKFVKRINSAEAVLHDSALPAATQELVKLRASQINGCGFCTDMHTKDALHAGESQGSATRASKHRNTDTTQTPAITTVMPR